LDEGLSRPAVRVDNLSFQFNRWGVQVRAIDEISLSVEAGEWLNLIGPNGSGKSTLLKLLTGELTIQDGNIEIFGQDLNSVSLRDLSSAIFKIHQDPTKGTAPALTVFEHFYLANQMSSSPLGKPALRKELEVSLLRWKLDVKLEQPVSSLSGGQRQLLTLLIARTKGTPILALDEPFAALDPARTKLGIELLGKLQEEGCTIIMVTHDMSHAIQTGQRTIGLKDGRISYEAFGEMRNKAAVALLWQ
jgi:putative ABC transport system ATP-binding protein